MKEKIEKIVQETVEKTLGKMQLMLIQLTAENGALKAENTELKAKLPKPQ